MVEKIKVQPNSANDLTIYGVGDLLIMGEDPASVLSLVAPIINEADIAFGQLEVPLSERGTPQVGGRFALRASAKKIPLALRNAGFDVVSFASNHCLDWGVDAFLDTLDAMRNNGIQVVGAGKDIAEARKPVIIEKKGTKVAFLAYNSILPNGYWADTNAPGCAPMRIWTHYENSEAHQPGLPPHILTFANSADLEAMKQDIASVKPLADVIVASFHWGLHFIPAEIAMYQREVGHAAIDAGADLVLGQHPHILKAIEVYQGKVIFYSLGNFAVDLTIPASAWETPKFKQLMKMHPGWKFDPQYVTYPFPPDSKKTIIAKARLKNKRIEQVSFSPVLTNKQSQPQVITQRDSNSEEIKRYIEQVSKDQNIGTNFTWDNGEVVINTR